MTATLRPPMMNRRIRASVSAHPSSSVGIQLRRNLCALRSTVSKGAKAAGIWITQRRRCHEWHLTSWCGHCVPDRNAKYGCVIVERAWMPTPNCEDGRDPATRWSTIQLSQCKPGKVAYSGRKGDPESRKARALRVANLLSEPPCGVDEWAFCSTSCPVARRSPQARGSSLHGALAPMPSLSR